MKHRYQTALLAALALALPVQAQVPAWPQFRGPEGRGVAPDIKPLPVEFGPTKYLWKTPLSSGVSSPCVWADLIFITAHQADGNRLQTVALNRETGRILWRRHAPAEKIERVYKVNSPASATPATDGERVYVSFGSYGVLCYDFTGKELWNTPLPTPRTGFGSATSPVVAGEFVLLNGQGKDQHLVALDKHTGKVAWTTSPAPFPSDYPTPLVWKQPGATEVIVPGKGGLVAFDLKDGRKRWWVPGLSPEVCCSPTAGDGLLFVASHLPGGDPDLRMKLPEFDTLLKPHDKNKDEKLDRKEVPTDLIIFTRGGKDGVGEIHLHHMYWLFDKNKDDAIDRKEWEQMTKTPFTNSLFAIRPGGEGDVTASHVAWQARRGIPEVPSPLYYDGRIYLIRNGGILTCLDAKTGKPAYAQQRLGVDGIFYASPVAGDGKVYLVTDAGIVIVLRAGDRFEVLAQNELGEPVSATPALLDGRVYVRTAGHLYAFGK